MSRAKTDFVDGSLFVVEDKCTFSADRSKGTVIVESTDDNFPAAIEQLRDAAARNLATSYATSAEGMSDARINDNLIGPYAINKDGVPIDKIMEDNAANPLPANHASLQPAAYRVEVRVARSLR